VIQHFFLYLRFLKYLAPMEIQSPVLTVEDIVSIHREWITKLFIEDECTEAEIVGILGKRHLFVRYTTILLIASSQLTYSKILAYSRLSNKMGSDPIRRYRYFIVCNTRLV
jgi:hypothetical protein